jgi:3-dehydroquinate synthase
MKTVRVNTTKPYLIKIGSNLLQTIGAEVTALGGVTKVCIVSDSNVFPLYGEIVLNSLEQAGFTVTHFVFPAGEQMKNAQTFLELLNHLASSEVTRSDCIVALGGGVVGDLAGFTASCYLRGIRLVQVPTTLLAAVDSSVGGKTAIDLDAGKNLVGAFWQPSLVICDTDTLNTLSKDIFRDGCSEVIKYAVLYDPDLFEELMVSGMDFDREAVITRCVEWKRDVVAKDEYDTGCRMKLNLGHTIGHGVEAKSDFSISHGKGVSIGMAIVARAAAKFGMCDDICRLKIQNILTRFQLPVSTDYAAEEIYTYTLSDKKRAGSYIRLIIPREIGRCDIVPTPITELKTFIEAGL